MQIVKSGLFNSNKVDFYKDGEENICMTAEQLGRALGYNNPRESVNKLIQRHTYLLDREFSTGVNLTSVEGNREVARVVRVFLEDGIYEVAMLSKTEKALEFKGWAREVIKSIRKNGAYITPSKVEEMLNDPDVMINLLNKLKEERRLKEELQVKVIQNQPKVEFYNAVANSESLITVGALAKILKQNGFDTSQNKLFQELRDKGYLIKQKGSNHNIPTQKAMDLGLFKLIEINVIHSDGRITIEATPKVTGKGQQYFINKYLGGKE
jgi:anti-repressor protein